MKRFLVCVFSYFFFFHLLCGFLIRFSFSMYIIIACALLRKILLSLPSIFITSSLPSMLFIQLKFFFLYRFLLLVVCAEFVHWIPKAFSLNVYDLNLNQSIWNCLIWYWLWKLFVLSPSFFLFFLRFVYIKYSDFDYIVSHMHFVFCFIFWFLENIFRLLNSI